MKYPVKMAFRAGRMYLPGDTFETDSASRASDMQRRRLIGRALPEPPAEPEPPVEAPPEQPVDEPVTEASEYPLHKGGGYYLLSDGSTVQGKGAAIEAEAALGSMNGGETE